MKNCLKKIVAIILVTVLMFQYLPKKMASANAADTIETVSGFEVDTYGSSTPHVKHHILKDSSQGVVLNEGDVMTFSADVFMKTGFNGTFRFGVDIREAVKGDEADWFVYNNQVWYRKTSSEWASQTGKTWSMWQDTQYKIECIVEAYKKVTINAYKYNNGQYDIKGTFEYAWNDVESIAQATEADGAKFTPMLLFKNVDATVSNIQLNVLRNGEVATVSGFEVDTYDSGTAYIKHHLLKDSSQGIVLKEGDVMTFSADVFMKTGFNSNFRFGIDIREAVKGDEADWFVNNNAVLYRTTSSEWAKDSGKKWNVWQNTQYQIECIVEAYEKVTIKAYEFHDSRYELIDSFEYAWNDVESIDQVTEADGAKFTPMLLFKNVDATVSNVMIVVENVGSGTVPETTPPPVMGAEDVNLAEGRTMPTTFSGVGDRLLDVGKIETVAETATWYYSGTFEYTKITDSTSGDVYAGLNLIFGEATYKGTTRRNLAVTARPYVKNGTVAGTQVVVWAGVNSSALRVAATSVKYEINKEYIYTVKVCDGKLSFWIDEDLIIEDFDLINMDNNPITDIKPKFGFNADSSGGNISDIKIWGDLVRVKPAIRNNETANLVLGSEEHPYFASGQTYYYDNENICVEGNSWYYSTKFQYDYVSKNGYGGLTFIFGEATYTAGKATSETEAQVTGTHELAITTRSFRKSDVAQDAQLVLWADSNAVKVADVHGYRVETGKVYTATVEVVDGKLTFWLDEFLICELDLASLGITDVKPKFGIIADACNGSVLSTQIWDGQTTDKQPKFTSADDNYALIQSVNITPKTDKFELNGIKFTNNGEYYYSARVEENTGHVRLIVAKVGNTTVEAYYDGVEVHLVKNDGQTDETIIRHAVQVNLQGPLDYKVKNNNGTISVWVNDILVISKVMLEDAKAAVGISSAGASGKVTEICLWGDVAKSDGILYQKFQDIEPYRSDTKTYPAGNGYVFAGWYQSDDESKPIEEHTTSGAAYAKFVPEKVLSIQTHLLKDASYSSEKTNLRFVTSVDSLQYKNISISLNSDGKSREFTGLDVYKRIDVPKGEGAVYESPRKTFCDESAYFFTVNIKDVNAFDSVWTAVPSWTTLDGTKVNGTTLNVAVNDQFNKRITREHMNLNGSTMLQIASNSSTNSTMSYLIKTKEGKLIVIDGGNKDNADYLTWVIKNRYGKSSVDAWYITHEDEVHYGALKSILSEGTLEVQNVYYNFLEKSSSDFKKELQSNNNAIAVGQTTHTYGEVKVHVVNDHKSYSSTYEQNSANADKSTMVLLVEFGGAENTGVLFLSDLRNETEKYVLKQAEKLGITLAGKVVQIAKHGESACSKSFYEYLQPTACLWTSSRDAWDSSVELRNFLVEKGVLNHYSAAKVNYEFY